MDARIQTRRVYALAEPGDGCRILVDRMWPRGLRKADADLDYWLKAIAPSTELRKWFNHEPARFTEFRRWYQLELDNNPDAVQQLLELSRQHDSLTLLYAARDCEHNHAVVLADYLQKVSAQGAAP